LDRVLHAARVVFLRHGISRARVVDIAAELGVSRATVYRQAGNVEQIAALLLRWQLGEMASELGSRFAEAESVSDISQTLCNAMAMIVADPLFRKVAEDEPEVVGKTLAKQFGLVIDLVVGNLREPFDILVARGFLAKDDTHFMSELLVRLAVTLLLTPPEDGAASFLERVLSGLLRQDALSPVGRINQTQAPEGGLG
jgi:AcrR family transcriptional regulator